MSGFPVLSVLKRGKYKMNCKKKKKSYLKGLMLHETAHILFDVLLQQLSFDIEFYSSFLLLKTIKVKLFCDCLKLNE